jgi:hypothetical protein
MSGTPQEITNAVVRDIQIITARPKGWSYKKYKEHLKHQNDWIKERLRRGFLCYKAAEIVSVPKDPTQKPDENGKIKDEDIVKMYKTYPPFTGSARYDLKPL